MPKKDRCVVRNTAYRRSGVSIRERHNERKNLNYSNSDIDLSRSHLNVHFKECEGTYTEKFDSMVEAGTISTRGLQKDAKIIDEMVFDVNTAYFNRNGGYDYAKGFFAEAYKLAIKEACGEEYVLSAVMHADERNKALSEELGRDIYHYHLHVTYIPTVVKEVKWTTRCKDPALVGTVKEVIRQVSHSKKWSSEKALDEQGKVITDENGKVKLINSYSLLQDRFFEHMREAGYTDFERGERGSTAEHLSVLDYKIQQENQRLDLLGDEIQVQTDELQDKQHQSSVLDKKLDRGKEQFVNLQKQLKVSSKSAAMYEEIESMGKQKLGGKYEYSQKEQHRLLQLSKEGLSSRSTILDLKDTLSRILKDLGIYKNRWSELKIRTRDFLEIERLYPYETKKFFDTVKQKPPAIEKQMESHQKTDEDFGR